jgi:hydrogenase maturation protease
VIEVLIIGYGNRLRRDDGAGVRVARCVERWQCPGVACLAPQQLVPELAEDLSRSRRALFVDAALTEKVMVMRLLESAAVPPGLAHTSTPAALLAWSHALYGRCPPAWLLTIPAADLGHGFGLSPQARRSVREALAWARSWLRQPSSPT